MNYGYHSSESSGASIFVLERFPALRLDDEKDSEEADEMERLKDRQRQQEEGKCQQDQEHKHEEPVLA